MNVGAGPTPLDPSCARSGSVTGRPPRGSQEEDIRDTKLPAATALSRRPPVGIDIHGEHQGLSTNRGGRADLATGLTTEGPDFPRLRGPAAAACFRLTAGECRWEKQRGS